VNSATLYLLRNIASGMPRIANIMWGMGKHVGLDEAMVGIIEGMNAQALAQVLLASNAILYSALSPYFQETRPIDESPGISHGSELPPITSDISDSSSCEQTMEMDGGGLMFQSADFDEDEDTDRLDYVITQADVSRMARIASRHLNVDSVDRLPTTVYRAKDRLICSSHEDDHEDENVDEFLLRNAQIIEDYIDNAEDNAEYTNDEDVEQECQRVDAGLDLKNEPSQFSWMMVPEDPMDDEITRMSHSILPGDVPESISVKEECNSHDDDAFEHCVICSEPFADGECLRVLPCQHMFHCGCIDKWPSREDGERCDRSVVVGCPACKKSTEPDQQAQPNVCDDQPQGESHQSDGTVPSWAFARLGSLLSGLNHEST
jgi:hypothetical protein